MPRIDEHPGHSAPRKPAKKKRYTPSVRPQTKTPVNPAPPPSRPAKPHGRGHAGEQPSTPRSAKRTAARAYTRAPLAGRRRAVAAATVTPAAKRDRFDKEVLRIHGIRHAKDVKTINKYGFLPRAAAHQAGNNLAFLTKFIMDSQQHDPRVSVTLPGHSKKEVDYVHETDRKRLEAAGFHAPHGLESLAEAPKFALGALASGAAVAEATYHDPLGVPVKTAKQGLRALPAIPGGLYDLATHPRKTISKQAKEFAERGGQPYAERVKAVRKEGGLNYGGDAVVVFGGSSTAAKLGMRLTHKGADATPRAAVRTSGGHAKTPKGGGILRDAAGIALDRRRAAKAEKAVRAAEAGGKPVSALVHQVVTANRKAGRPVEVAGRNPGLRQRSFVAKQRGRAVYGMRRDQQRRLAADAKHINRLNKKETRAFYYATAHGIRNPDRHAVQLLSNLRDSIKATRAAERIVVTGSLKKSDMLPEIEKILADPAGHFTPRLAAHVEGLRADSIRAGREDPSLRTANQRMLRRYDPQAQLLNIRRGEPEGGATEWHYVPGPDDFAQAAHRAGRPDGGRVIDAELAALRGDRAPGERRVGPRRGAQFRGAPVPGVAMAEAVARINGALDLPNRRQRSGKGYYEERPASGGYFDEGDADFIRRLQAAGEAKGLAKPLYFKSERYSGDPDLAARTVGGIKAMAADRRYEGVNLRQGLQDTSPNVYLRGKARNIKRKHNWNLVADIVDANDIKSLSRGGDTVSAIMERAAKAGIDHSSFALWNPGVYRMFIRDHRGPSEDERFAQGEEFEQASVAAAMSNAIVRVVDGHIVDGNGLPVKQAVLLKQRGWRTVPTQVLRELEAQMVPSHISGRVWDIMKGKASRAMLLTVNVPWLGFQVVSNVGMTTVATGGRALNPANWLGAYRWWKEMTPEEQQQVGGILGLDATSADAHQIKLGASTTNTFVNGYRAIKAHPFWHTSTPALYVGREGVRLDRHGGSSISGLNPLERMAAADRSQNNVARILAGYSLAKRDAVRHMGEGMGRHDRALTKLTAVMAKPPVEQLRALRENPEVLEAHADALNTWLGDYTKMTAAERKIVGRAVMFYPYLRYSLRLLFYTMPVKHPAVTAILGELGLMKSDELAKLFGEGNLPWNSGKIYFGSGDNVKSIDLRRANPALNAPIDAAQHQSLGKLLGITPPYIQWLVDQATDESTFTGKDWKVEGVAAPYGGAHPPIFSGTRLRILADDIMGLTFPYRTGEKLTQSGPQGDDSTLLDPRPTNYKGRDSLSKLNRKFGARREAFAEAHEDLIHQLIPLLPNADRSAAEAREERIIKRATPIPGHPARRKQPKPFGSDRQSKPRKVKPYGAS